MIAAEDTIVLWRITEDSFALTGWGWLALWFLVCAISTRR